MRVCDITYDGRRIAENREKKNDEWTEGEGKRGNRVRHRGREAPLIGRWHGRTLQSPWGYMNPGTALSLSLFHSLLLTLSHLPPHNLPSLRFYPTAKRRRVTWTQKRSIRASPTRPLSPTRCFSLSFFHIYILLYHPPTRLATLGQSLISRYSVENLDWKISEREERY